MKPLTYKKEKVIKEDGRYIIFYEFEKSPKPEKPESESPDPPASATR